MTKLRKRRSPKALPEIFERIVPSHLRAHVQEGDVLITKERPKRTSTRAIFPPRCQYMIEVYPDPEAQSISIFPSFKNAASVAEQYATLHHARVVYVEDEEPIVLADYRRGADSRIDFDVLAARELRLLSDRERLAVMAKKRARRRSSQRRDSINTGRDKRYVKRTASGRFKESDDVGKSLSQDRGARPSGP